MRIFTDGERRQMGRKPIDLEELESRGIAMTDFRLGSLEMATKERINFRGSLRDLNYAIKDARFNAFEDCEFLAFRLAFGSDDVVAVYAVNTEGGDYARYAGLIRKF